MRIPTHRNFSLSEWQRVLTELQESVRTYGYVPYSRLMKYIASPENRYFESSWGWEIDDVFSGTRRVNNAEAYFELEEPTKLK